MLPETQTPPSRSRAAAAAARFALWLAPLALLLVAATASRGAEGGSAGVSEGQLLRGAGLFAAVSALILLVLAEFVFRRRMARGTYHLLLLVGLFMLPVIAILGASATVLEETKTVASCNSCHIMNPFVNDMKDPNSATLAARHYKNGWIPDHQCYSCHTTYGVHGTLEGKRDGLRHWLLYVTGTWKEPINYKGSYPNINCTGCHAGTPKFQRVPSHAALNRYLSKDQVGCITCHGPSHPTPLERPVTPGKEAPK